MELVLKTRLFEMCIRTNKMYSPAHDDVLPPMFNVQFGHRVWRMGKGWLNLKNV
jgi:hypothetical protein